MKKTRITVDLSDRDHKALEELQRRRQEVSKAAVIRDLIRAAHRLMTPESSK